MLTIRLQRTGTKNKPQFRIVLAEAHKSASKKFQEILGHYHPSNKAFGIKDEERLKYWLGQHVQLSPTVHNLLIDKKFITDEKKVKAWKPKKKEGSDAPAAPAASAAPSAPAEAAPAAEPAPAETPAV